MSTSLFRRFGCGTLAAVFILVALVRATAQTPAFPGALGNGAYVTGGHGGSVYHVTNLNDSGTGSFRDAVNGSGRIVVFDVGGTINLLTAVSAKGNLTIAGQTAPGGIKFDGGEISFSSRSNIICRFIRVRPGSDTAASTDDAIAFANGRRMIFDHCSIAFAPWNNVGAVSSAWQTTPVTDITFQHCINANPTGQQFGAHTESVNSDWTWCYNLFANSHNRNPLAKVNNVFINNIEYNNSAGYTTHTSTKFKHDIVNNYFVAGPGSSGNFPWYQIDNNQSMYFTGNLYDGDKNGVLGGSTTVPLPGYQGGGTILSSPFSAWTSIIPTMTPALAWRYDLSAAGAFPRDEVDALIVSQVKTLGSGTTGTGAGTAGPGGGFYTSQTQTGLGNNGYGTLTGLTAPTDSDNDAMPDYWELATGSATNVLNPQTNTATGYSLLENYLNYLAAPHVVTRTNTPVDLNLSSLVSGFAASATFSVTNATNGSISLLNATNAHFIPTANFSGLGGFNFIVTESSYSLNVAVTVCVTPVPPPASAVAFNGALVMVTTNAASSSPPPLPANLTWRGDGSANAWNTTSSNWFNGVGLAAFKNADVVTIDDTGTNTPAITVSGGLSPGALLFSHTKNYTIAGGGSWSGSGSFTKSGTGKLTIGTTNSLSGNINIRDGMVSLVSGTTIGSGGIVLAGGGTLDVQGGGGGSTITGPVTVAPGENVTLSSGQLSTSFDGAIATSSTNSVLNLSNSVSFNGTASSQFSGFYGTVRIVSGATLRFESDPVGATFGALSPSFVVDGTMKPRLAGSTIQLGSISGTGLLTGQEKPATNGGNGRVVYNIGGNNTDSTFAGVISDALSITNPTCLLKTGTGRLTLTGKNTFTSTNTVSAGTLLLNGTNTPSLTIVNSGATLGGGGVITNPVSVKSGGILSPGPQGGGSIGTLTIVGHVTNATPVMNFDLSASPAGVNDRINMTGTLEMSGAQTFNFNLTEFALGAGTYGLIEGANNSTTNNVTFAHNLPVATRQTFLLTNSAVGANPSYVRLTVSGSAANLIWRGTNGVNWDTSTVNWDNVSTPDTYYNLDAVTFDDTGANAASVTLASTLTPGVITVNAVQNYAFIGGGALAGTSPLKKSGNGTLTIGTVNSAYAGKIYLSGGTLALNGGTSIGSGALVISNNATFALPGSGSSVFIGGAVSVPAGQTANITSGVLSSGFSGNFSSGNSNVVLNLSGGMSFSGTTSAQFDGFTGTINLQPGAELRYSANSSGNTFGSLNPTLVINGTLHPRNAGNTVVLGTISGSGIISGPQSTNGTGDTLYVIGGNNSSSTFTGTISSNSSAFSGEVALTKTGSGTLTLTGTSTYTGGTTVEDGTLRMNNITGSGTGSGDVEIFSGATLAGSGIIAGATTLDNGATLAPGNSAGTLTFSNSLTLNDGTVMQFELGTNSDHVVVSGAFALAGTINVTAIGGFGAGTYTLFNYTPASGYDIGNVTLGTLPAGSYNYALATNTPGQVNLVVSTTAPPILSAPVYSGGNLILSGTGGTPGTNYYVLTSTNVVLPMVNWTPLATNQFDGSGNFAFTNAVSIGTPQLFYRVQVP